MLSIPFGEVASVLVENVLPANVLPANVLVANVELIVLVMLFEGVMKNGGDFLLVRFASVEPDFDGDTLLELALEVDEGCAVGESGPRGDCESRMGLNVWLPSFRNVRSCRKTPM